MFEASDIVINRRHQGWILPYHATARDKARRYTASPFVEMSTVFANNELGKGIAFVVPRLEMLHSLEIGSSAIGSPYRIAATKGLKVPRSGCFTRGSSCATTSDSTAALFPDFRD